jgi:hypothetical protein
MRSAVLVLAVALVALVLGISAPDVRAAAPTLRILSPANDAIIGNGTPVAIIFAVADFNLTAPGTGGPPNRNEGHVDVYVDDTWTMSASQPTIELALASGTYNIRLRLVMDNGTPLSPDVSSSVTVSVTQGPAVGAPRIEITYVEIAYPDPHVVLDDDVILSFKITDFALVPPERGTPVPNEGHVAVYLDNVYIKAVVSFEPVPFSDLPDGEHTVTLRLVDDAGNPLSPDASDSITFRIQSSPVVDINPYLIDAQIVLAVAMLVVLLYRDWGRDVFAGWIGRLRRGKA